ncbi:MAG: hypothetical protein K0S61_2217 [Anaerocolumna sp.]|nr:hypothetical protein [Anaerocolumna sp.]
MMKSNLNNQSYFAEFQDIKELSEHLIQIKDKTNDKGLVRSLDLIQEKLHKIQSEMISNTVKNSVAEFFGNTLTQAGSNLSEELHIVRNENISLKIATALIHEVELKAIKMGVKAVIAVYNSGANPVAVHVMDDAYIASYDVATNKAYTSAALKMSTLTLKDLSQPGGSLYGIQNTNQGRIVIFGGGEPLYYKDILIGALGVSGGSEEQDTELAEFGKIKLKEVIEW